MRLVVILCSRPYRDITIRNHVGKHRITEIHEKPVSRLDTQNVYSKEYGAIYI